MAGTFQKQYQQLQDYHNGVIPNKIEDPFERSGVKVISTPILNVPAMTETATTSEIKNKFGNWVDYTTSAYYILQKLFLDNNWTQLACTTIAAVASKSRPPFVFEDEKSKRNSSLIKTLTELLEYPNNNETWSKLISKTYISLALFGDAYWQIIPNMAGGIYGIYSVPTPSIRPIPYVDKNNGDLRFVFCQVGTRDGVKYDVTRVFDDTQIVHFKTNNPFDIVYGLSKFSSLFANLSFDVQGKTYLNNYMKNAYSGGMIFEMRDSHKDIVERNRIELEELLSGSQNAGRNMILEGEVRLVHDGNKTKDFPLSELMSENASTIMPCAGVPLSVAGLRTDDRIDPAQIEAEEISFLRNTIEPFQDIVYPTINQKIIRDYYKVKDLKIGAGVNRHFSFKRAETMVETAMKVGGTVNEFREILGLSKLQNESGEQLLIATNNGAVPLDIFLKSIEQDYKNKMLDLEKKILEVEQLKNNLINANNTENTTDTTMPSLKVSTSNGVGSVKVE